jgi:hypothetical protein
MALFNHVGDRIKDNKSFTRQSHCQSADCNFDIVVPGRKDSLDQFGTQRAQPSRRLLHFSLYCSSPPVVAILDFTHGMKRRNHSQLQPWTAVSVISDFSPRLYLVKMH